MYYIKTLISYILKNWIVLKMYTKKSTDKIANS